MSSAALFVQNQCNETVAAGSVLCPSGELCAANAFKLDIIPSNADLLNTLKPASFHSITATVTEADAAEFTHQKHLGTIKELLLPGGQYTHQETSSRVPDDISLELMIAGLDVASSSTANGTSVFVASLPAASSAAAPLPKAAGSAWGVVDGSAELVDEDALLAGDNAEDAIKASGDCSTKPRACADCSCGRAEAEAKADQAALTEDQLQSFTSACGNCFKGDAFRCASCPHRGKPAFVPGMEGVMLDLGADDAEGPIAIE